MAFNAERPSKASTVRPFFSRKPSYSRPAPRDIHPSRTKGRVWSALIHSPFYRNTDELIASFVLLGMIGFYALLLIIKSLLDRYFENYPTLHAIYFVIATLMTVVFINSSSPDFIYFQF